MTVKKYKLRELWEEIEYHANRNQMIGIDYLIALLSFYRYKGGKRMINKQQLENIIKNSKGRIAIGRAISEEIIFFHLLDTVNKHKYTQNNIHNVIEDCVEMLNKNYPSLGTTIISKNKSVIVLRVNKREVQIQNGMTIVDTCSLIARSTYGEVWDSEYSVNIFAQVYELYIKYT